MAEAEKRKTSGPARPPTALLLVLTPLLLLLVLWGLDQLIR